MTPLGAVKTVTAGTPSALASSETRATKIWIQPMRSLSVAGTTPVPNTGTIYLMNTSAAKGASSTNIFASIGSLDNVILLESQQREGWDLSKIYMDADNTGDGALISYA